MKIDEYFTNTNGRGILSTADKSGNVNAALYAKPYMLEDDQIAFIMRERLTHNNLLENPGAAYLFMEEGRGYKGVRLHLEKTKEEHDSARMEELQRQCSDDEEMEIEGRYLVSFRVKKILPLIGSGDPGVGL